MPSTVIHLLPVEVLMVVDMLPYYLLNRGEGSHTFWTSMASVFNFKHWIEEALENQNLGLLDFALGCLKNASLNEMLADMATFPDTKYVDLDVETLRGRNFQTHDASVEIVDLCHLLCNQIFLLKFKLLNWEGHDNFDVKAEVASREPPKMVYSYPRDKWQAVYGEVQDGEILLEDLLPRDRSDTNRGKKRKAEVESEPSKAKKQANGIAEKIKLPEVVNFYSDELDELLETVTSATEGATTTISTEKVSNGETCLNKGFEKPKSDPWPFDNFEDVCGQGHNEQEEPVDEKKAEQKSEKTEFHFHFHFNNSPQNSKLSVECNAGNFKMSFE